MARRFCFFLPLAAVLCMALVPIQSASAQTPPAASTKVAGGSVAWGQVV